MRKQSWQVRLIPLLSSSGIIKGLSNNNCAAKVDTLLSRSHRVTAKVRVVEKAARKGLCVLKRSSSAAFQMSPKPGSHLLAAADAGKNPILPQERAGDAPSRPLGSSCSGTTHTSSLAFRAEILIWTAADAADVRTFPFPQHAVRLW